MHTTTALQVPGETGLNSEAIKLAQKAEIIYASLGNVPGDYSQRFVDTRTKERPSLKDLENIKTVVSEMMNNRRVNGKAFQSIWIVSCIVYSVVIAFLLLKGWKKEINYCSTSKTEDDIKNKYLREANQMRKELSVAKAEFE